MAPCSIKPSQHSFRKKDFEELTKLERSIRPPWFFQAINNPRYSANLEIFYFEIPMEQRFFAYNLVKVD